MKKNFLFIGSNIGFAENLKKQQLLEITQIIDTKDRSVIDIINELTKIEIEFDSYIIQLESIFNDEKSLGKSHGLELIKHILLTESLGKKRNKKIIALSFFNFHYFVKKNADNIILCAPNVSLIDIVLSPQIIAENILKACHSYDINFSKKLEDFEKNLINYIITTVDEEVKYKHQARNFFGLQKLYREFYFSIDKDNYPSNYEETIKKLLAENPNFVKDSNVIFHKKLLLKHKINDLHSVKVEAPKNVKILLIEDKEYWKPFFQHVLGSDNVLTPDFDEDKINIEEQPIWNILTYYSNSIKEAYKDTLTIFCNNIQNSEIDSYTADIKQRFNFVFLDLRLLQSDSTEKNHNILSGIKVLKKIRSINPLLPICVFTASEDTVSIKYSFMYGCNTYFNKDRDSLFTLYELMHSNMINWEENKAIGELLFLLKVGDIKIPKLTRTASKAINYHQESSYYLYVEEMSIVEKNTLIGRINEEFNKIQKNDIEKPSSAIKYNKTVFQEIKNILKESFGLTADIADFSYQTILRSIEQTFKSENNRTEKGEKQEIQGRYIRFNDIKKDFAEFEQLYESYKPFSVEIKNVNDKTFTVCPNDIKVRDEEYYVEKTQMKKVLGDKYSEKLKKGDTFNAVKRKSFYGEKESSNDIEVIDFYSF